jgi:hypothetical protein
MQRLSKYLMLAAAVLFIIPVAVVSNISSSPPFSARPTYRMDNTT